MRILVTGGAGFIGKYLIRSLFENGHSVTIFDNFSNSTKDSTSYLTKNKINVIEGDILNIDELYQVTKNQDIVIHLAAKISVPESIKNPKKTIQVNVKGTSNVLIACEKNHIQKLIVASSAAVYGESLPNIKLNEKFLTNPISPYGESKTLMEEKIREFELEHNIDCIILRFFNIYGIGQSSEYAGVITKFIKKIKEKQPLEIFGDGLQTRDFVSIEDVISSFHNAISNGKSGTYNIASGKTVTIKELADFMILLSKKQLDVQFTSSLKGDIRNSQADISLAKNELNFSPKFKLDKIKEMLE